MRRISAPSIYQGAMLNPGKVKVTIGIRSQKKKPSRKVVFSTWAAITTALTVLTGAVLYLWYSDNIDTFLNGLYWKVWRDWVMPHGILKPWRASPVAMVLMAIILGYLTMYLFKHSRITKNPWMITFGVSSALLMIGSVVTGINGYRLGAAHYANATTVITKTDQDPAILQNIRPSSVDTTKEDCDQLIEHHGLATCFNVVDDIHLEWQPYPVSGVLAEIDIAREANSDELSSPIPSSLTYLPDRKAWTAVRDGSARRTLAGIQEWSEDGKIRECTFQGRNTLDWSFNGLAGRNLTNLINEKFNVNQWDMESIWGYCSEGNIPTIVIPTTIKSGYGHRTVEKFGGVILVTGSVNGVPNISLVSDISPGAIPGPIYPASLAKKQRESFNYSGGIWARLTEDFGYTTSTVPSQSKEPSEYLLQSKIDGRLYWVTPLRSRGSSSEQIVAYSTVRADEATSGELNNHNLYILKRDNPDVADLQQMHERAVNAINERHGSFFTGGSDVTAPGRLTELLPAGQGVWQTYAVRGGDVVSRVEVNVDYNIRPKTHSLSGASEDAESTCDIPEGLSSTQIQECIQHLTDELSRRSEN